MLEPAETLGRLLQAFAASPFLAMMTRPPGRPPIPGDKDSILNTSPLRRQLYEKIVAEPGITASKVKADLDMQEGTLANHLAKLTRADLVELRLIDGTRRLYPAGEAPDTKEGLFTSPTQRDVAAAVLAYPEGVSSGVVAEAVGITQRMAQRHLLRLVDRRFVSMSGAGPSTTYAPTAKLRKALQPEQ